jgi:chemotaxis protein MotB
MDDDDDDEQESTKPNPLTWLITYGDMITLILCFFVIMMGDPTNDNSRIQLVVNAFGGLGPLTGGMTFNKGKLAYMGETVAQLPASERAQSLNKAQRQAQSLMSPTDNRVVRKISIDPERGLVITLASDALFEPDSATVNIVATRESLQKLAVFLNSSVVADNYFRIEGHTNTSMPDPSLWPTNWELSSARSVNVLHALKDYGLKSDSHFQVAGFADTRPLALGDTPESAALNRRVEIVVLTSGHL